MITRIVLRSLLFLVMMMFMKSTGSSAAPAVMPFPRVLFSVSTIIALTQPTTTTAAAWVEKKMLFSWIMNKKRCRVPGLSILHDRQQSFLPLVMISKNDMVDAVPPGRFRRYISLQKQQSSFNSNNNGNGVGKASILSRTVPVTADCDIIVWEWEKPAAVVETYWQVEQQGLSLTTTSSSTTSYAMADSDNSSSSKNTNSKAAPTLLDPFGLVCWPGSVVASQEMKEHVDYFQNKVVLVLGAGVGVEAQAAALIGQAKQVIATDIHPTTLRLLQYGAEQAGLSSIIKTRLLDLDSLEPLPTCDVMVVADLLYNENIALKVIQRVVEARQCSPPVKVLISDSQRFVTDFETLLSEKLQDGRAVQWVARWLPSFTGSGVLVDDDQTYEVRARIIWIGEDDDDNRE
jgi:predicted nicotinamide N-methyase